VPLATDLFDYTLPPHLVAQTPAAKRDQSRLLVVDRATRCLSHVLFSDLPQFLRGGDILIRNTAAVLPARLEAVRPTGGQVECFLLRPFADATTWRCLLKPGRKLPTGSVFAHPTGAFAAEVVAKEPDGSAVVKFKTCGSESIVDVANRLGVAPLPPYIARRSPSSAATASERERDLARYQTVYANPARQVAVAAPTAGLHFTAELLALLAGLGVHTADITLHVGLGTFKPIATERIEDHPIHQELYEVPVETQRVLRAAIPGRRVAVGTTSVRTIEDYLSRAQSALEEPCIHEAGLFIYPPRAFRGVDALITNFHQPRSTLLCLVAACLTPGSTDGIGWIQEIYREAIAREYRFFSYGDAMLIL
jgi:S-adenosylmethionine:tRNA ribosyltransferase-isomerase